MEKENEFYKDSIAYYEIDNKRNKKITIRLKKHNSLKMSIDDLKYDLIQTIKLEVDNSKIIYFSAILNDNSFCFHLNLDYYLPLNQYIIGFKSIINNDNKMKIIKQILESIKYLHEDDIIHNNLALDNFIITDILNLNLKLLHPDFCQFKNSLDGDSNLLYQSEERIKSYKSNSTSNDIYSIGILIVKIIKFKTQLLGKLNKEDLTKLKLNGEQFIKILLRNLFIPINFKRLIINCLNKVEYRPSINALLDQFNEIDLINFNLPTIDSVPFNPIYIDDIICLKFNQYEGKMVQKYTEEEIYDSMNKIDFITYFKLILEDKLTDDLPQKLNLIPISISNLGLIYSIIGDYFYFGLESKSQDLRLAMEFYYKSVEYNHIPSMRKLAQLFIFNGELSLGIQFYLFAIDNKDIQSSIELIEILIQNKLFNSKLSNILLDLLSDSEDPKVYYYLALMYFHGLGTFKVDMEKSKKLFTIALSNRIFESSIYLSLIEHYNGNPAEAIKFLNSNLSNIESSVLSHNLAVIYYKNKQFDLMYDCLIQSYKIQLKEEQFYSQTLLFLSKVEIDGLGCKKSLENGVQYLKLGIEKLNCCQCQYQLSLLAYKYNLKISFDQYLKQSEEQGYFRSKGLLGKINFYNFKIIESKEVLEACLKLNDLSVIPYLCIIYLILLPNHLKAYELMINNYKQDKNVKFLLAQCYKMGTGTEKNIKNYIKILVELAAENHSPSCYELAQYYQEVDLQLSFKFYRKLANKNDFLMQIYQKLKSELNEPSFTFSNNSNSFSNMNSASSSKNISSDFEDLLSPLKSHLINSPNQNQKSKDFLDSKFKLNLEFNF